MRRSHAIASLAVFWMLALPAVAASALPPGAPPPPFGLPFATGERARLLQGPHTNNADVCAAPGRGAACNALDLVPASGLVRAAGAGIVHTIPYCRPGLVAIDHRDGWWSGYYHLTGVSVSNGQPVAAGQVLGRIGRTTPCGGSANPAHVHFFLKYVPPGRTIGDIFQHTSVDVDLRGLLLAGWTIAGRQWSACMTFQATGQRACAGQNIVNHGNAPPPPPPPPPPAPQPGPNLLQNASFNTGNPAPWFRNSHAGNINIVDYVTPSLSEDGGGFLAANTSVPGGSIAQDLTATPLPGHTYTFSVWLRSRDGTPMSTTVAAWALGTPNVSASRVVTIGGTWQQVAVSLTVPSAGCRALRAEVYMTTTGHTLNLDNASFTA